MVSTVIFALLLAAAVATPLNNESDGDLIAPVVGHVVPDLGDVSLGDNDVEPDWQMVPDGDGLMHLVDVNDMAPEPFFNPSNDIRVLLFTRNSRNHPQEITLNNVGELWDSHFNPAHRTRIIIHGWNNDGNSNVNNLLRHAYLDHGLFNVFIVDWGRGARTINYLAARNRVPDVGHFVAQYIDFLHREGRTTLSWITVIGHGLGAHSAGIAGKRVLSGRLQNIVALDAAHSLFTVSNHNNRVHFNDAVYVESIHTDTGRSGFDYPLGDAAFYPNGGTRQPGCIIDLFGACSHSRAYEFFAETIGPNNRYWASRCESYQNILLGTCPPAGPPQLMGGEPLLRKPSGVYYLETNQFRPFGQGYRQ